MWLAGVYGPDAALSSPKQLWCVKFSLISSSGLCHQSGLPIAGAHPANTTLSNIGSWLLAHTGKPQFLQFYPSIPRHSCQRGGADDWES